MTWPDAPVEGPRSVWVPWGDQSNSDGLRETHRHCRCRGRAAAHCQQDGRVAFSLSPYNATTKNLFRPTVKMQQISEVLADAGEPTSYNQIKDERWGEGRVRAHRGRLVDCGGLRQRHYRIRQLSAAHSHQAIHIPAPVRVFPWSPSVSRTQVSQVCPCVPVLQGHRDGNTPSEHEHDGCLRGGPCRRCGPVDSCQRRAELPRCVLWVVGAPCLIGTQEDETQRPSRSGKIGGRLLAPADPMAGEGDCDHGLRGHGWAGQPAHRWLGA